MREGNDEVLIKFVIYPVRDKFYGIFLKKKEHKLF